MKLIALIICLFCWNSVAAPEKVLFSDDFEKGYHSAIYQYLKAHGHDAIIAPKQGREGSNGLEVIYVSIYKGSTRMKGFFPLSRKVTEASLSYDVKFREDFQFVKGGKLHGLGPDHPITGNWKKRPDGWSARVMWGKAGKLTTVLEEQDSKAQWGIYKGNDKFLFKKGKYYAVTLYVKLNSSPKRKDGLAQIYVDGKLLVSHENIRFWKKDDARISRFLFSTFHGGGTADWAPKDKDGNHINVHAYFDNFKVSEGLVIAK